MTNIDRAAWVIQKKLDVIPLSAMDTARRLADAGLLASEYSAEHQHSAEVCHVLNEVLHAKAKGRKTVRIDDLLGDTDA